MSKLISDIFISKNFVQTIKSKALNFEPTPQIPGFDIQPVHLAK